MKIGAVLLLFVAVVWCDAGGVRLRQENDALGLFVKSDEYYTQGLQIEYVSDWSRGGDTLTSDAYGLRNTIYTPRNIKIAEPQPDDRPWAGLTAIGWTRVMVRPGVYSRREWIAGVVGPWSGSDYIQTEFHRWTGNTLPEGWSNQIPNEVIVNYTERHHVLLGDAGVKGSWGADVALTYGGSVGTAFVYGEIGLVGRAGWNVPDDYFGGTIMPTLVRRSDWSAYFFSQVGGRAMFHNICLSGSLFQDGPRQKMKPFVVDANLGVAFGKRKLFGSGFDFNLSYAMNYRTAEFWDQERAHVFGSFELAVTRGF